MASPLTPKSKADIASSILRMMIEHKLVPRKPDGSPNTLVDYINQALEATDRIVQHCEKPKSKKEPIA